MSVEFYTQHEAMDVAMSTPQGDDAVLRYYQFLGDEHKFAAQST